jgi:hypothetical protein
MKLSKLSKMDIINEIDWFMNLKHIYNFDCDKYSYQIAFGYRKGNRENVYAVFVNGKNTQNVYPTMDEALAFAIAYRNDGINTRAHIYFIKSIQPIK